MLWGTLTKALLNLQVLNIRSFALIPQAGPLAIKRDQTGGSAFPKPILSVSDPLAVLWDSFCSLWTLWWLPLNISIISFGNTRYDCIKEKIHKTEWLLPSYGFFLVCFRVLLLPSMEIKNWQCIFIDFVSIYWNWKQYLLQNIKTKFIFS